MKFTETIWLHAQNTAFVPPSSFFINLTFSCSALLWSCSLLLQLNLLPVGVKTMPGEVDINLSPKPLPLPPPASLLNQITPLTHAHRSPFFTQLPFIPSTSLLSASSSFLTRSLCNFYLLASHWLCEKNVFGLNPIGEKLVCFYDFSGSACLGVFACVCMFVSSDWCTTTMAEAAVSFD